MKFGTLLSLLPLVAANAVSARCSSTTPAIPSPEPSLPQPVPEECCCMSYKATCTMNLERMIHVKMFYNRKNGTTPEEFNHYWANNHVELVRDMHLRLGVVRYSQYHSTPDFRDQLRGNGLEILEFDGAAEWWMPSLETFAAMGSDPHYLNVVQPDEANFIDVTSIRTIVGADYIVVENQNAVMEHGRIF